MRDDRAWQKIGANPSYDRNDGCSREGRLQRILDADTVSGAEKSRRGFVRECGGGEEMRKGGTY